MINNRDNTKCYRCKEIKKFLIYTKPLFSKRIKKYCWNCYIDKYGHQPKKHREFSLMKDNNLFVLLGIISVIAFIIGLIILM